MLAKEKMFNKWQRKDFRSARKKPLYTEIRVNLGFTQRMIAFFEANWNQVKIYTNLPCYDLLRSGLSLLLFSVDLILDF